jgi:hypothetical protein
MLLGTNTMRGGFVSDRNKTIHGDAIQVQNKINITDHSRSDH